MLYWGPGSRVAMVVLGLVLAGHAHAQTAVPEGYTDTLNWYHQQAEAGNARAQFLLAIKYETGTDVAKDLTRAAGLYERAARQGLADAQFKLATLLQTGRGRTADRRAAELWYRAAALQAHPPAQFNLGVLLLNDAESDDDAAEAISWILRADRAGLAAAAALTARLPGAHSEETIRNARELAQVPLSRDGNTR